MNIDRGVVTGEAVEATASPISEAGSFAVNKRLIVLVQEIKKKLFLLVKENISGNKIQRF